LWVANRVDCHCPLTVFDSHHSSELIADPNIDAIYNALPNGRN
jgi:predicted dehydrogenase